MTPLTPAERQQVEAWLKIADAATPGPWIAGFRGGTSRGRRVSVWKGKGPRLICLTTTPRPQNVRFIALARTALPWALTKLLEGG